jgi:hypothetical protein
MPCTCDATAVVSAVVLSSSTRTGRGTATRAYRLARALLIAGVAALVPVAAFATEQVVRQTADPARYAPWAEGGPTADANAASPVWTRITTVKPTRAGAQVLSASYTLPAGTVQAVRAQFRYGGDAAVVCGRGTFDDRDDLVFMVNP